MEKIKLIIWDLDETLWKGTISDGDDIELNLNFATLIKNLTDKGIINSICSKNEFKDAQKVLEKFGLWDLFVFSSIDWTPKGGRVNKIIKDMNLRPINCLFVDDNINNLKEASFVTPELRTCLPQDLLKIINSNTEAFKGKEDRAHSRLKQYKILERMVSERSQASSNDEFLMQSDIHVEMIESSLQLERIHEMIHRNNQLNFTKDRIDIDTVREIFEKRKDVRRGVVRAWDKYGDHGIIGCYAVENNRLLQFVFSCRILGLGVEQYVYYKLGFPEIDVVPPCASELNKGEIPYWINKDQSTQNSKEVVKADDIKKNNVLMYGGCSLRPIWAYLESRLNVKFFEIFPATSICNLSVIMKEDDCFLREIKDNYDFVSIYDEVKSKMLDVNYESIIISLHEDFKQYKYTNTLSGKYFFAGSSQIKIDKAKWTVTPSSVNDITNELSYVLKNSNKNVFVVNNPNVVFAGQDKDDEYDYRINSNRALLELENTFNNLRIVDMCKYAKSPMNFYDTCSNHYNRDIAFMLSNDILEQLGTVAKKDTKLTKELCFEWCERDYKVNDIVFTIRIAVHNFRIYYQILGLDKYDFNCIEVFIYNNNELLCSSDLSVFDCPINNFGIYHVKLKFEFEGKNYIFTSKTVSFLSGNLDKRVDANLSEYDLSGFISNVCRKSNYLSKEIQYISCILSRNESISDFFVKKGISEIELYSDYSLLRPIFSALNLKKLKVSKVFCNSLSKDVVCDSYDSDNVRIELLSKDTIGSMNKGKVILVASDLSKDISLHKFFTKKGYMVYELDYILTHIITEIKFKRLFDHIATSVPFVVVRAITNTYASISNLLTKNEKQAFVSDNSLDKSDEVFKEPELMREDKFPYNAFKDKKGERLNIIDGFRKVCYKTSTTYKNKIFVFGGRTAFGYGVDDTSTLSSHLQKKFPDSDVVDMSNYFKTEDIDSAIKLMQEIRFKEGDSVIFLYDEYLLPYTNKQSWFNYDALDNSYFCIDVKQMLKGTDRPDYFVSPKSYSSDFYRDLSFVISNIITVYYGNNLFRKLHNLDKRALLSFIKEHSNTQHSLLSDCIKLYPFYCDQYNDRFFFKEYVRYLLENNNFKKAFELFNSVPCIYRQPIESLYNIFARAYLKYGDLESAEYYYSKLNNKEATDALRYISNLKTGECVEN